MKDVFRSGDSSKKFKIAEGQWYRYAPSYRSEERFSRNAETDLVCRLLLEKKKQKQTETAPPPRQRPGAGRCSSRRAPRHSAGDQLRGSGRYIYPRDGGL